jgi:thiol:disulfide interchange protein
MKPAHKPIAFIFAVFVAMIAIVGISRLRAGNDIIPWRTDLAAAQAESSQSGKPVFAYFTAEWCSPCQSMKRTTWSDTNVELALQGYVPVKIDIDAHRDLAARYQVNAIPMFAILDNEGNARARTEGAMSAAELINWIKKH